MFQYLLKIEEKGEIQTDVYIEELTRKCPKSQKDRDSSKLAYSKVIGREGAARSGRGFTSSNHSHNT